jgi:uridine kinase
MGRGLAVAVVKSGSSSHNEGVVLVGLGGASGSGKTAFSEKVRGTRQQQQQEC